MNILEKIALPLVAIVITSVGAIAQTDYISGITYPDSSKQLIVSDTVPAVRFASTITAEDMRKHLTILASDEYEGRETGQKGNIMASAYLGEQLRGTPVKAGGLERTYFQPVAFTFTKWIDTDMYVRGKRYKHLWDYISFPELNENAPITQDDEVIYMGYGIDDPKYTDYKKAKVKDKIILINKGEPLNADGTSWITGDTTMSAWSTDIEKKLILARAKGAKLVLIIEDDIKGMLAQNRRKILGGSMQLGNTTEDNSGMANHAYISTTIAKALFGEQAGKVVKARKKIAKKGKFKAVKLKDVNYIFNQSKEQTVLESRNVVGMIKGSELPDEYVVVSAHLDHLGKRGDDVYNGADDNGSGTTAVLELAQALGIATKYGYRPKRTVIFLWVTGEEKGLLGSAYYAANPIYPLEQTVANVNIDMVGRVDPTYEAQGIEDYIYVIGSDRLSTDLHKINEDVNAKYTGLVLDYTYNSKDDPNQFYFRSDHYNFAKNGIPAIFFFNGTHDDYHQITDTVDKINFDKMQEVGRHIFHVVWELANRKDRIVVDGVTE
jgi:hypothetical protein